MDWRHLANWAKERELTLQAAGWLGRRRGRWNVFDRMHPAPAALRRPDLTGWETHDLAAVWIGHATILLRVGGLTILTDPVFSARVGLGLGLITGGPRRHVAPALALAELPPIDLILVSHAHFDHLDRPTLIKLSRRIPILTAHRNADLLRDLGFRSVTELRWGESTTFRGVTVTAREVRHWGARTFYDAFRGFNAFLIDGGGRRVLYGGDTAYHDYFKDIGRVDLAILGIGAYDPYIAAHATPEQAWEMANHVRADHVLPMHHSTFRLSHEPMGEPIARLLDAAGNDIGRVVARKVGDQFSL